MKPAHGHGQKRRLQCFVALGAAFLALITGIAAEPGKAAADATVPAPGRQPAVLVLNASGPTDIDFPLIRSLHLRDGFQMDYLTVNNPSDQPVKATLKKAMDFPEFEFPDQTVELPAGGFTVLREK